MSLDDDAGLARFALLEGFFRRRDETGKFYCATCLVAQLRARGSRAFSLAAVQGAVKDVFKRPGELQLKLVGTCDGCYKPRPCVGGATRVRERRPRALMYSFLLSLVLAVIGIVLWIEGGPHPRTWGAWNANIMKAITRARAIVATGSGMRDTARILVPGAWQRAASPEREWGRRLAEVGAARV